MPKEAKSSKPKGLEIKPYFSDGAKHPFEEISWAQRDAVIKGKKKIIFEQKNVKVPEFWSDQTLAIVCSKYFGGSGPTREKGVDEMIKRVSGTITKWGKKQGYFKTAKDAKIFDYELCHLLVDQKMSFNSPVWFNLGLKENPQTSACFILDVKDNMEHIGRNMLVEMKIFRWGSGCGSNRSPLRASMELISEGGVASGPVSFILIYDTEAGVVKSGGKMRRAAKMEILDADHPDIFHFVDAKALEERKAHALIEAGYPNDEAYEAVSLQNCNLAVRLTDEFMKRIEVDGDWFTTFRVTDEKYDTFKARALLKRIAKAVHFCGDPGLQFDDTINRYHTCADTSRINASNPCSEFMFIDNSACNLASLNLMRFRNPDGALDIEAYKQAVRLTIIAQDILIKHSGFPIEEITRNSQNYRPLGLGYANLGAFLISNAYAYGSSEAHALAGALTSLMTSSAYLTSRELAEAVGPFAKYKSNRASFQRVLEQHTLSSKKLEHEMIATFDDDQHIAVIEEACKIWDSLTDKEINSTIGFRNAQVTLLAPTGTISLMMGAETTGIEPYLDIEVQKDLVGGGSLSLTGRAYSLGLRKLGYTKEEVQGIEEALTSGTPIADLDLKREEHFDLFATALGERKLRPKDHIDIMSYVQPYLSGAISKTINLPEASTADEIYELLVYAWKKGLKSITLYRDGSKWLQPLSKKAQTAKGLAPLLWGQRRKLPADRDSHCHEFSIAGRKGFLHIGFFDDKKPAELFIRMSKEGSLVSGVLDLAATCASFALQYGCPLEKLVDKFSWTRYEPAGITSNEKIRFAQSIGDYIFRYLATTFLEQHQLPDAPADKLKLPSSLGNQPEISKIADKAVPSQDAPFCPNCEQQMYRSGTCFQCRNCGESDGVCQ